MLKLPYNEIPVKVIHSPTKEEFFKLVQLAKEPFKVTGVMDHWVLFKILSQLKDPIDKCDYLASLAQNERVSFTVIPPEQKGILGLNEKLEQNFSFTSKKALFPEFINQVKKYLGTPNVGNLYLQSTPIEDLNNKLGALELFEGFSPMSQPRFWIGTGNQFISLHNDPFRNIIALFAGQKRVIMFPPEELPNVYPAPFDKRAGGVISSLVNAFKPDLKKFPLFKRALKNVKIAIINPGEFLYMPPLWWHAVEGKSFNVGLNCWFRDDGGAGKLHNFYLPAESLMLNINRHFIPDIKRNQLYKSFLQNIESDIEPSEVTDKLDLQVVKEAKKIKSIINESPLSDNQKNIWKQWVSAYAQYIFCIQDNMFPTLHRNEFSYMIKRLQKSKISRNIKLVIYDCLSYIRNLVKNKKEKHGIVPF